IAGHLRSYSIRKLNKPSLMAAPPLAALHKNRRGRPLARCARVRPKVFPVVFKIMNYRTTAGVKAFRKHWKHPVRIDTDKASPYAETMNVHLTDDQKAFIRQAIETGRFQSEEDAVEEALALWEERERARAEILADVDLAEASLAQGKGRMITEQSMRELAS